MSSADLRAMLAQQDHLQHFDALVISAEIGVMKPDAAAYQARPRDARTGNAYLYLYR